MISCLNKFTALGSSHCARATVRFQKLNDVVATVSLSLAKQKLPANLPDRSKKLQPVHPSSLNSRLFNLQRLDGRFQTTTKLDPRHLEFDFVAYEALPRATLESDPKPKTVCDV